MESLENSSKWDDEGGGRPSFVAAQYWVLPSQPYGLEGNQKDIERKRDKELSGY